MAEYMDKEVFLSSMGLIGDETKYGNRDAEHQSRSYSTYMSYEIMDSVEDSIVEEELESVKHGRWIEAAGGRTICNQCGEYPLYDYFGRLKLSTACPHCGSKMDLEVDHAKE